MDSKQQISPPEQRLPEHGPQEQGPEDRSVFVSVAFACLLFTAAWLITQEFWTSVRIMLLAIFIIRVLIWLVRWMIRNAASIVFVMLLLAGTLWAKEHPKEFCKEFPRVCSVDLQAKNADIKAHVCLKIPGLCNDDESGTGRRRGLGGERGAASNEIAGQALLEQPAASYDANPQFSTPPSSLGRSAYPGLDRGSYRDDAADGGRGGSNDSASYQSKTYDGNDGPGADSAASTGSTGGGALCSPEDPDFDGYRYGSVPHCKRHVSKGMKRRLKRDAGISPEQYGQYEIDHIIPLGLGGNNSPENLQQLPHADAREKSRLEQELFNKLSSGEISQAEAVERIRAWRPTSQLP